MPLRHRWLIVAACACAPRAYTDATWLNAGAPTDRSGLAVGCVDVALSLPRVPEVPAENPVLRIIMGNRCAHPVPVDLTALEVRARDFAGVEQRLVVVDKRGELRPATLEANGLAVETLEFVRMRPGGALSTVCVDLSRVTPVRRPVALRCRSTHDASTVLDRERAP